MGRQPVTLSLDEEIWKEFKKDCIDKGIDASTRVEEYMGKSSNEKRR